MSIAAYFPFSRIRIVKQWVGMKANWTWIEAFPGKRFHPICHLCGSQGVRVHSHHLRLIRDLNFASERVSIKYHYRKFHCPKCQRILIEYLNLFDPYLRVTKRLARYIFNLCRIMTIKEIAEHLRLDWKTIKAIEKRLLEENYGQTDYQDLRILAVYKISIHNGHRYLTVVLDYLTERVVWVGKDCKARILKWFFAGMKKSKER